MKYLEENNLINDNKQKAEDIRIFALYTFIIITFFTIILFLINNKFYDKLYLLSCIIVQLFSISSIYFNKKYFLSLLNKFFTVLIVIGILFITTKNILLTILFVLIVTLISRNYLKSCLFFYWDNSEYNIISDVGYFLLLIINLYKILYVK